MNVNLSGRVIALSPAAIRLLLGLALATLSFGVFIEVTAELYEDSEVTEIDRAILLVIGRLRSDRLNQMFVDLTALGSPTIVALFTVIALLILVVNQETRAAFYVLVNSVGAMLLTILVKLTVGRQRPEVIPHLVEVAGQSYPSGHTLAATSLYLALTLVACLHFRSWRIRAILLVVAGGLILLIGFSRLYLGVHYPSDVVSGVFLG